MVRSYAPIEDCPNIVFIGVKNKHKLEQVLKHLKEVQIGHAPWIEPDYDLGFTSIATIPISGEKRIPLQKKYQKYKFSAEALSNQLGGSCLTPPPDYPVV